MRKPFNVGQKFVNQSGHLRTLSNKRDKQGRFTQEFGLICEDRTRPYMVDSYAGVVEYMEKNSFSTHPQNILVISISKRRYRCKVYWEMSAEVDVLADGETDAQVQALNMVPVSNGPGVSNVQFVPDSENCDVDMDVQLI